MKKQKYNFFKPQTYKPTLVGCVKVQRAGNMHLVIGARGDLIECCADKDSALQLARKLTQAEGLKEFDRSRNWRSLYDIEQERAE